MMDTNAIIGLDSAYICAQETGSGNMQISASLVVELIDRLRAAEAERQELHHAQNSLLDRLSDLTAYKEAAEKQESVAYQMREPGRLEVMHTRNPGDAKRMEGKGLIVTPLFAKPVPADKPERITEQDAMAILLEWDAYRAERSASGVTPAHFKKWLSLVGRDLINKLNADREQVPAVAVPDGWTLVPIEPTEQMRNAANVIDENYPERKLFSSELFMDVYRAMLAAAPSHSQQSATNLLTWLPSLLDHYEKQAQLNGFTPDTSLKMCRAAMAGHSQQVVVHGYLIGDGFTEQFVKTLSDEDRKAAKRFNWDVIALCRCPSHESEAQ